jgi:hypothetical protein
MNITKQLLERIGKLRKGNKSYKYHINYTDADIDQSYNSAINAVLTILDREKVI